MIIENARKQLLVGINKTADVVKSTLGYKGKTVLIHDPLLLTTQVTKDGVTVAKSVRLEKDVEVLGSEMIKAAAQNTLKEVGDNTTTTTILTQSMCNNIDRQIDLGIPYNNLINCLKNDEKKVLDYLHRNRKNVRNTEDIWNIAYVASNNDPVISDLIKNVYDNSNFDVVIDIRESDSEEDSFEVVSGYTMENTGYVSPIFINNYEKGTVEYENPEVIICNGKIKQIDNTLMEIVGKRNTDPNSADYGPTVIICQDVDEVPLREFYTGVKQEMLKDICIVTTNLIYNDRKSIFIDASQVLNAEYTEDRIGRAGKCKKIVIEKDKVTFIEGEGNPEKYIKSLEEQYKNTDNMFIKNRIFSLKSRAAVVNIGGKLSTERKERIDRVDDAVRAVRASIEEGYVPGGASVFIHAWNEVDFETIVLKDALYECYAQLMRNAELNEQYYLRDILLNPIPYSYNLKRNEVSDMLEDGIYDSVKGLRVSIQNAVSTAITFGNIEYILT